MKKNIIYITVTIIVAGLIAWAVYNRLNKKDEEAVKPVNEKVNSVVKVKTYKAEKKDLSLYINTMGTAKAIKSVAIKSKVSGDIKKLHVHENSYVRKGSKIIEIENEEFTLNLKSSQNELALAQIEYGIRKDQSDPAIKVTGSGSISEIDEKIANLKSRRNSLPVRKYEEMLMDLETEKLFADKDRKKILRHSTGLSGKYVSYQKAKCDYDNTIIKAPFSGYIANLTITSNENIGIGYQCADLIDISTIKMEIPVLESEVGRLKEGREVTARFTSFPEKEFKGKIKYISPVVDEESKTSKVIVHIRNKKSLIKPGMTAKVTIEGEIYKDRLIVPKEAIIVRDNRKLLFIVEDNKAKWLYVKTGLANFDYVEVLDKLKEGMDVVISNNYTLAHDAQVKIIN